MRRAAGSIFGLAVALSLALHSVLMVSPSAWWAALAPADEAAFPIDAILAMPPPPASRGTPVPVLTPTPVPPAVVADPASAAPEVSPPPWPATAPAALAPPAQTAPAVVTQPVVAPVQPEPLSPPIPPSAPTRSVLRQLPEQMTLTYAVAMGEGGFKGGRSVYEWRRQGGRYSLKSRTEATGLLSLFMSGQIVQESSGEIGAEGLRPEQFRLQRGDRRSDQARFDHAGQQLVLNGEAQALRALTQDLLSFPFHLGLTLQPGQAPFILPVTDGRKLRGYRVSAPVSETQDGRALWRLHAWRDGDGEIDLWFDLERGGLPLRIRSQDSKGQVMTLTLEADR